MLGPVEAPARPAHLVARAEPELEPAHRRGTVTLHAGFNPDPHVVHGTAKGEVLASSIRKKCKGWISEQPDYLLHSETAFFRIHILARSEDEIFLVVRDPEGSVFCSDARKETNEPRVKAELPLGTTQVWIGVKRKGLQSKYTLGFSEMSSKPSELPAPR